MSDQHRYTGNQFCESCITTVHLFMINYLKCTYLNAYITVSKNTMLCSGRFCASSIGSLQRGAWLPNSASLMNQLMQAKCGLEVPGMY